MLNTNIFIGLWNLCKNLENIEKDLKGCLLIYIFLFPSIVSQETIGLLIHSFTCVIEYLMFRSKNKCNIESRPKWSNYTTFHVN